MFHRIVSSNELISVEAKVSAFSSGIAEIVAGKSDIAVCISPHKIEAITTAAFLIAFGSDSVAASSSMAHEQLDEKSRNFEESIHEGSSDNTSPVSGEQSIKRSVPFGLRIVPIPIAGSSRNDEVDYIDTFLHASLRNWNPQMNSRMFSIPRTPGLVKSQ